MNMTPRVVHDAMRLVLLGSLCLAGVTSLCAADLPDWQAQRSALPQLPPPVAEDWLVDRVLRQAGVYQGANLAEIVLDNGLVRRTFRLSPNAATVALDGLTRNESFVRAVRPEAEISLDGKWFSVGGLSGQPIGNYLLPDWLDGLTSDPSSFRFVGFQVTPLQPRFSWKPRSEWLPWDLPWPPPGIELTLYFAPPASEQSPLAGVRIAVHYELYDGLPLLAKWLTVENGTDRPLTVDSFKSEILACVEATSEVEELVRPPLPNLHVETDFTTCSMSGAGAQRQTVYWLPDPTYATQVNYLLRTPCVLECRPPLGPDYVIEPGKSFSSFRTWMLVHDSTDLVRQSLSLGRMYRTIAPWVAENPLIMHVRSAAPDAVRLAIDQSVDVGFDLVIMTFGSGFNLEDESADYLAQMRELTDYAHQRGVALGGYSLLASRSIGPDDDVVNPATGRPGGFATFGNSPCVGSRWGQDYFRKLYQFYEQTGCDVLEHDGSYPGDPCAATHHPGHRGYADSRWNQWQTVTQFYQWCRGRGIYLNVPDWYFLHGSNKTGMGYRETNWSLPRAQQELIERQNICDGTRFKTPSMGWMFVPLTEYHGGGAEATIEPLHEHRDHYARRLANLWGAGVQACFRGPRLYDTAETRAVVRQWVDFYRRHQAILNSDMISLRRADGRDWDGWVHVNPRRSPCALAMLYNPLPVPISRTMDVPLYYAGLRDKAQRCIADGDAQIVDLDRQQRAKITVDLPPQGCTWITFQPVIP